MKRIIKFGSEARQKLLEGIDLSTKAIKPTLGPRGASAIIYTSSQPFPLLADDGAIVAKCIQSEEQAVNAGCAIIKEVATQSDNGVGDGTSSATILAHSIITDALKAIDRGVSKRNLKNGIVQATELAKKSIADITKTIETEEQLKNVAFISSNDKDIAELVGSAVHRVGKYGVVQVEEGLSQETQVIDANGIKFERGFIDRYLTTDPIRGIFQSDNCRIMLLDHELDSVAECIKILSLAVTKGEPILIVCNGCRNEAVLAYMHANKKQYGLNICIVKAPGHGDLKKQYLQDIADATGATIIGDATGVSLDKLVVTETSSNADQYMKLLGTGKVTVLQYATTIVVNEKTDAAIKAAETIKAELDRTDLTPYDRNILEERYANLTSGISLIKVGGSTDTEIAARKVKIDDAKNATMSANKYGYVLGGGSAYLYASHKIMESLEGVKESESKIGEIEGMIIVATALTKVTKQLIENSGITGDDAESLFKVICSSINDEKDTPKTGFNALSNQVVDMYDAGIIDSAKVVTNSLDKAASIASTVIMAETLITEEAEPEDKINYSLAHRK